MLSHCCKAGYHVCTPLNPNVRNRQHVCSAARLSPLGTGVPGGILSSPGTGLQLGTGAVPRADVPGSCEHFWPIVLCYEHFWPTKPRDIPEIVGRKRTEQAAIGRKRTELTRDTATRPLRPHPGTEACPQRGHFGLSRPRPQRGHPERMGAQNEYANDPVLSICKGGVDIVS